MCDTEMYGFILKAVELPLSRGSFVKILGAHCIGDVLALLEFLIFFGAKTV